MALVSSLDDDSQGAQVLAPGIPNRALPKEGLATFPEVPVANVSTRRGAVLLPSGQSTKRPSLLSCRYFLIPLNTRDSINCFKRARSLSLSLATSPSMPTSNSAEDFSSGPVNAALRMRRTSLMTRKSKRNFSRERRIITVAP